MTLIIQKPTGAKLVMRKGWQPMDADAAAYITAVETADAQALEEGTKIAIDNFVLGCKEDGIWSAIKASCILAGARTLNGCLVPLAGTAPTNVGGLFVSGDYNRKTGLVGDGSTKYLNSNRSNSADGQDNQHVAIYQTALGTIAAARLISGRDPSTSTGSTQLTDREFSQTTINEAFSRFNGSGVILARGVTPKFFGITRSASSGFTVRQSGIVTTVTATSATPNNTSITIFANPAPNSFTDARLAFYSIGESLNLALLDARVTDLINAFAAAIP
jgi:hypothetical protein